ncbi:flagellar hook-associated protein 2 [Gracilibacillus orientalis]|uniref:Flagellar hook-associated protein 2 n=1 Tax=Gracilibacillus orientalis TaxID=334253 RepID=A0A1I4P734_9BACI|nr:flagellar filament capping protein FliD [Gracilibacillus orientalis]SFM23519.1 flagellar hook-associated protein 2 [Gracilibacillus orientalis]
MRINGMASGMDIDQMVRDLMKAESMPLQRMEQEKQVLEWKRDDYREMNTLMLDFRSQLTDMRMSTNYRARQVTSSDESKVTATVSSSASESSYDISNVTQLASAATLKNGGAISADSTDKIDASKSLFSQDGKLAAGVTWKQGAIKDQNITAEADNEVIQLGDAVSDTGAMDIQVNGKGFKVITDQNTTLADDEVYVNGTTGDLTFADGVVKQGDTISAEYVTADRTETKTLESDITSYQLDGGSINSLNVDIDGTSYTIGNTTGNENEYELTDGTNSIGTINTNTGKLNFDNAVTSGSAISATYDQNYASFDVGAHTSDGETYQNFVISGNETLNGLTSKVSNADLGVSMMYDSFSDQLTLTRTETGDYNTSGTEIMTNGDFINNALKFGTGTETGGKNAQFTINGLDTEREKNTFEIDGVTFNIKQTFTDSVSTNVSNDTEAVYENITEFVDTYNTLIDAVNSKVYEEHHRDYKPLTDEQRESLSDTQQEDWTDMAKSGLLRRDSILQGALSDIRSDFYASVNNDDSVNSFSHLSDLGITTTSDYMSGGKLEIDDKKLREAIESDPDGVQNIFSSDGDTYEEQGITTRLFDTVNSSMDRIYERAGRATATESQYTIGRNLTDIEDQITRFEDRLQQKEDRYYSQFTAMEQAMQRYNSQAQYMQQALGGMGGGGM